ncbi:T9SS type A sorting domain-containing protein [Pontibacter sp. G13]|uniref:T9SS type A sorting domain-containing protein n=1 Tax=Pontibacter sp. G13 TaxID=3074898 RepID=UPI00288AEC3A|nr:T9SS type A sorting domain-containing protein [Pontibacter sp. G13]WNJ18593.1 T9SS type A sorting domain-containing protein [Pontibacter sp. G13]
MKSFTIVLSFLIFTAVNLQAQLPTLAVGYQVFKGIDTDTVKVYMINTTNANINVGSVNMSIAYQSATATYSEVNYSMFENVWGNNFIQYKGNSAVSNTYDAVNYDRRFQYGHSYFTPNPVAIKPYSGVPTLVLSVVFNTTGTSSYYQESLAENPANNIRDMVPSEIGYSVYEGGSTFPVEWLSFDAHQVGSGMVQLNWSTASESNNAEFEIERSLDGISFMEIGRTPGKGTTQEISEYAFMDRDAKPGIQYYRLRQIDIDGASDYSEVRQILVSQEFDFALTLYPNPAHHFVNIESTVGADIEFDLKIMDLSGRTVYTKSDLTFLQPHVMIPIADLSEGTYLLQLSDESGQRQSTQIFQKE